MSWKSEICWWICCPTFVLPLMSGRTAGWLLFPYRFLVVIATTTTRSIPLQSRLELLSQLLSSSCHTQTTREQISLPFLSYIHSREGWEKGLIWFRFSIRKKTFTDRHLNFFGEMRAWKLAVPPILVFSDFCVSPPAFFVCPVHLSPSFLLVIGFTVTVSLSVSSTLSYFFSRLESPSRKKRRSEGNISCYYWQSSKIEFSYWKALFKLL